MKKLYIHILLVIGVLLNICTPVQAQPGNILTPNEISAPATGGNYSVNRSDTGSLSVLGVPSWVNIDATSLASGQSVLTFTCNANTDPAQRIGSIAVMTSGFGMGTLTITQAGSSGSEEIFSVYSIDVSGAGGTYNVDRTAGTLTLISADSWIHVDNSSLISGTSLVFTCDQNNTSFPRDGIIMVSDGSGNTGELIVSQEEFTGTVEIFPDPYFEISVEGGNFSVNRTPGVLTLVSSPSWVQVDASSLLSGNTLNFSCGSHANGTVIRSGTIKVEDAQGGTDQLEVLQNPPKPDMPGEPTYTYQDGKTILTKPSAPFLIEYYWQNSANRENTGSAAASATKEFTENGVYYLRALDVGSYQWGDARTGNVKIYYNPSQPAAPTAAYAHALTTLTMPDVPEDEQYYWQTSAMGEDKSNPAATKEFTTDGDTYYLRAYHPVLDVWSTIQSGTVNVYSTPQMPPVPSASYADGITSLTKPTAPSPETYYWQTSASGTSTTDEASTKDFTIDGSSYHLRAYHPVLDVWSDTRQGSVRVETKPAAPATPMVNNQTGKTVLTMPTAPAGETYFWQETAEGTSLADSSPTKEVYVSKTVYLRSRKDAPTYLWSDATSIAVTVNEASVAYSNENYILTTIIEKEGVVNDTEINGLSVFEKSESIQYFDGLGRPKQMVNIKVTPDFQDLIQPVVYDDFGRERQVYLPFATTNRTTLGEIHDSPTDKNNWASHYQSGELDYVFADKEFDGSPLNRVLEQGAPGSAWRINRVNGVSDNSGQTLKMEYMTNQAGEVACFDIDENDNLINASSPHYAENELYKTLSKDENWKSGDGKLHTSEEFKDKLGQVVLKRTWLDGSSPLNTYYVYDDFGLLRYILPPKAFEDGNDNISATELEQLCYRYKYDGRKRMTHKKLPGADEVYMVYDKRDRLVATQDGNQRPNKQWLYTKYDELNRPIQTGIYTHTNEISQETMAGLVDGGTLGAELFETVMGDISTTVYSNNSFPNTRTNVLGETYYDNYDMLGSTGAFVSVSGFDITRFDKAKGQVTGTMTKVLESSQELYMVNHYDNKYRLIQSYATNIAGGYDRITTQYDFPGRAMKSLQSHKYDSGSAAKSILTENAYDHAGRLLTMHYTLDNGEQILMIQNSYNELGELTGKRLHNSKQEIDYSYNIRGWMTGINKGKTLADNRLFGMELYYNTTLSGAGNIPQYNGNISAMKWNHRDEGASAGHAYKFEYDNLNRLAGADYGTFNTTYAASNMFDVYGDLNGKIRYDLNGNIKSLKRNGGLGSLIDNLEYHYQGTNQLSNIRDYSELVNGFRELSTSTSATEYTYDANGNMETDLNKGLNIAYNSLNLPKRVNNRQSADDDVEFIYSATGVKLDKLRKGSLTNRYIGNFVYKGNGALDYIITPEGRLVNVNGNLVYEYYLKDHLGNTRNTFQIVNNTVVQKQKMDYYPFGMQLDKQFTSHDNKYLYNGKELQDDRFENGVNLNWLDYGNRMYDPALGRFFTQDRFAEKYFPLSPYQYAANNPILNIDINGDSIDTSGLTEKQLAKYNEQIALLSENKWFNAYYTFLSESETVFTISAQAGEKGTVAESGQFYNPQNNEVGVGPKIQAYAVAQELFHAFQNDGGWWSSLLWRMGR